MSIVKFNRLSLSDADITFLNQILKTDPLPTVAVRAFILLDLHAGMSIPELACKYKVGRPLIYRLINTFPDLTLALFGKPRPGRPPRN